jgi:hypothetical protein
VVAKENFKRIFMKKYLGNIYSEFSSVFCCAPYFYPNLTPKVANKHDLELSYSLKQNDSFNSTEINKFYALKNTFKSPISSKSKLFKLENEELDTNNDNKKNKNSDHKTLNQSLNLNSPEESDNENYDEEESIHLIVCVHGLEGNSGDLRLIRTYLELALPGAKIDFLMSSLENTFEDLENMGKSLISEINNHIETYGINPTRISFIGHSLGNLIIRAAVSHQNFKHLRDKLYTYLSLSGPHLGTLYNSSGLVNMGLWLMQKWKKSGSLLQLSLKDHSDLRKTFLYNMSKKPALEFFKQVLLVASIQDRYVPFHSARIEMCKAANRDSTYGTIYKEMVLNILKPILDNPKIIFKRFCSFYNLASGTSNLIGRAAHIAVLDSELFVEKLILVSVAKHFR